MEIYSYLNQKQTAALKGEKTGINFSYLGKIRKETPVQKAMKQLSGN